MKTNKEESQTNKIKVTESNGAEYELKPPRIYLFPINEKENGYYVKFPTKDRTKQTSIIKFLFEDYSYNKMTFAECALFLFKEEVGLRKKGVLYRFEKTKEYFYMYFKEVK